MFNNAKSFNNHFIIDKLNYELDLAKNEIHNSRLPYFTSEEILYLNSDDIHLVYEHGYVDKFKRACLHFLNSIQCTL